MHVARPVEAEEALPVHREVCCARHRIRHADAGALQRVAHPYRAAVLGAHDVAGAPRDQRAHEVALPGTGALLLSFNQGEGAPVARCDHEVGATAHDAAHHVGAALELPPPHLLLQAVERDLAVGLAHRQLGPARCHGQAAHHDAGREAADLAAGAGVPLHDASAEQGAEDARVARSSQVKGAHHVVYVPGDGGCHGAVPVLYAWAYSPGVCVLQARPALCDPGHPLLVCIEVVVAQQVFQGLRRQILHQESGEELTVSQGLGAGAGGQPLREVGPQALEPPRATHAEQGVAVALVVEAGAQLTRQVHPVSHKPMPFLHPRGVFFCFWRWPYLCIRQR